MAGEIKTELSIPDLWFDFYARFIPGCVFVTAVRFYSLGIKALPETGEFVFLAGVSYFVGILAQPISSRIVGVIETLTEGCKTTEIEKISESKNIICKFFEKLKKGFKNKLKRLCCKKSDEGNEKNNVDKNWLRILLYQIGRNSKDSLIISKMHGEGTLFVQLAVLTILFWVQEKWQLIYGLPYQDNFSFPFNIALIMFIIFLLGAMEIASRRAKRAWTLKELNDGGLIPKEKDKEKKDEQNC